MISSSSCFASSQPATSANVTFGVSPASSFAFDFPNAKARLPPCCICRSMKITSPKISRYGRNVSSTTPNDWPDSRARTSTPLVLSASTHLSSASNGSKTLKRSTVCRFTTTGRWKAPRTFCRSAISTDEMLPAFSSSMNWE